MKITTNEKYFLSIIGLLIAALYMNIDNKIDRNFSLISGISARLADVEK